LNHLPGLQFASWMTQSVKVEAVHLTSSMAQLTDGAWLKSGGVADTKQQTVHFFGGLSYMNAKAVSAYLSLRKHDFDYMFGVAR
jgi:hypothetical protein